MASYFYDNAYTDIIFFIIPYFSFLFALFIRKPAAVSINFYHYRLAASTYVTLLLYENVILDIILY